MKRFAHIKKCRQHRKELNQACIEMGLPELNHFSWKSWRKHPFANLKYEFWGIFPHKPDLELDWWTVGEVDHTEWGDDCYGGNYFSRCKKCGWSDQ